MIVPTFGTTTTIAAALFSVILILTGSVVGLPLLQQQQAYASSQQAQGPAASSSLSPTQAQSPPSQMQLPSQQQQLPSQQQQLPSQQQQLPSQQQQLPSQQQTQLSQQPLAPPAQAPPRQSTTFMCNPNSPLLQLGFTGAKVAELQRVLIQLGYGPFLGQSGIDGKFGTSTHNAVKKFQEDNRLTVDGIAGPITWRVLCSKMTISPTTPTPVSPPLTFAQSPPSQMQLSQQLGQDRVETGREPTLTPEAQPPTPQAAIALPTSNQQRLQVSFTSIRIINDHDPDVFGITNTGEWKIGALVNGQFRNFSPPGSKLDDAHGGSTYSLSNIQPIVLNVDKSKGALVISTIGQELDGCNFNYNIPPSVVAAGTALAATGVGALASGATTVLYYATQLKVAQSVINKVCNIVNSNDAIGIISDTYGPPTFGVGVHSTLSTPYSDSGRDFVLTYQIKPVQGPLQSQVQQQQQTGQFPQTSNTIVRDHRTTTPSSPPS